MFHAILHDRAYSYPFHMILSIFTYMVQLTAALHICCCCGCNNVYICCCGSKETELTELTELTEEPASGTVGRIYGYMHAAAATAYMLLWHSLT